MPSPRRWSGDAPAQDWTPPRPTPIPYIPIIKVPSGKDYYFLVCDRRVVSTEVHLVDGRTQPCTAKTGRCWVDHFQVGEPNWYGWLLVWNAEANGYGLLRLTPHAYKSCPELHLRDRDLSGRTIGVRRKHDGRVERMMCWIGDDVTELPDNVPAVDVYQLVNHIMAGKDLTAHEKGVRMLREKMRQEQGKAKPAN